MWRWVVILLGGIVIAPLALESFHRTGGSPARHRDMGETIAPEKIHSSWGKRLDPRGAIPNSGFKAFYFSGDNPGRVVFEENVDSIAIKYAWAEFHHINSPQFGAYWVGKLKFSRPVTRQISVSQSWAKSRILIDGEIVFDESNDSRTFSHDFSKGEHVMEVEFINNWHTVEYKVTVDDRVDTIEDSQVSEYIADNGKYPPNLYYVGLYESASRDTSVNVTLPYTGKPVALWLTSYEAIDWNIISSDQVSSVIVSSYAPGTRVRGTHVSRVARIGRAMGVHSETRRCSCAGGTFHCEDEQDLEDVARALRSVTNMELTGYAVKYSASELAISPYGRDDERRILDQRAASEAARKVCVGNANPNFDKLMN
jgi:hypothetical protein